MPASAVGITLGLGLLESLISSNDLDMNFMGNRIGKVLDNELNEKRSPVLKFAPIVCMGIVRIGIVCMLAACQHTENDTAENEAPPAAAEAQPNTGADIDPADIVWADEAFLNDAGVKEGKDVMYLPTPPMVVDKMIELAKIQPSDLVYDLGTGDGRIAIETAKQIGCKVVGYEIDPELVKLARENVRSNGVEHLVTIEEQDILALDYSDVDVVLMYLDIELNVQLLPQLQTLKPGARVVSHDWGMRGLIESEQVIENFLSKEPDFVNVHNIYLWEAPLRLKQ